MTASSGRTGLFVGAAITQTVGMPKPATNGRWSRPRSAGTVGVAGLAVLALALAGGCGSSGGGHPSAHDTDADSAQAAVSGHGLVHCPKPAAAAAPSWPAELPPDLPKPSPATVVDAFERDGGGLRQAEFVVPRSLREEVEFVLKELPAAGYQLGSGDAERTEADTPFAHGGLHGLIRLSALGPCRTQWTVVTVARNASPSGPLLPPHDESDDSGDSDGPAATEPDSPSESGSPAG